MTGGMIGDRLRVIPRMQDFPVNEEGRTLWKPDHSCHPGHAGTGQFVPPYLHFVPEDLLPNQIPRIVVATVLRPAFPPGGGCQQPGRHQAAPRRCCPL